MTTAAFAAPAEHSFAIPAQSTADALNTFARQSGRQIIFPYDLAARTSSPAVFGAMSDKRALKHLLSQTGFVADISRSGAITIYLKSAVKSLYPVAAPGTGEGPMDATAPQEVIVTGTKRNDIDKTQAGSVTVRTGRDLDQWGANGFADYLETAPGVAFFAAIPGISTASIRGVSTTTWIDQGQGTTGYYINDVPMTDPYFSVAVPDIDTFDVANVTILRGPQGTLFGSGALGGAINYIVNRPNLSRYGARMQMQTQTIEGGGEGISTRVLVNMPIVTDRLAVRAVLVNRHDPGFIDNAGLGRQNSNSGALWGGRLLATYRPLERTTLNYFYLDQTQDTPDVGFDDLALGPYKKSTRIPDAYRFRTRLHNLRLDEDLGIGALIMTLTQHEKRQAMSSDATGYFKNTFPGLTSAIYGAQVAASMGTTFETRLASKSAGKTDFVVSLFYDRTAEMFDSRYGAEGADAAIETLYASQYGSGIGRASTIDNGQTFYYSRLNFVGHEAAFFGEVGYQVLPNWRFLVGWRAFETRTQIRSATSGFLALKLLGTEDAVSAGRQNEHGILPKVSLTWTPNRHLTMYGLISNGFRFGGSNINPATSADPVPPTFGSDATINYELGARSDSLQGRLQLDLTAFYIKWDNIQTRYLNDAGVAYAVNAGRARNFGVEASAVARPVRALALQANLTYLDARLVDDVVLAGNLVPKGTTLPGASRWSVAGSVSYQWFDLPYQPSVVATYRGRSSVNSSLSAPGTQGGYDLIALYADLHLSDSLKLTAYVDNLSNVRGVTNTGAVLSEVHAYLVRPRTFGVTLDAVF